MYYIGVDLGQRVDPSGIAVVERMEQKLHGFDHLRWMQTTQALPDEWVVRMVERVRLGTPYTKIVERLEELARHEKLRGNCAMAIDGTGLGAPVLDMLRAARVECPVVAVTLTSGTGESFDGSIWRAPKVDLMARVQTLLEQERLRVAAKVRDGAALRRELLDVRAKRGARGLRVGAEGHGEHDDLVMAVALAVWVGRKERERRVGPMGRRVV